MEQLKVIGLDLAKNVFQVHGMDENGKKLISKKLKRAEVVPYFAQLPTVLVGMEACGGAHAWARQITDLGHRVKLMAPQHVKPFVQGNKTDARDAAAIAEAAQRQSVPSVAMRTIDSQQMQALHRVRELWMKQRIATANQIRGLLAEFGIVTSVGMKRLKADIAFWQAGVKTELGVLNGLITQLSEAWRAQDERISELEAQINQLHKDNAASRLIESIPGVGLLSATAVIASFGECEHFDSARKFASCVGLTPREHSSGGKQHLLGISKRGNGYVRKLLIHGARAVLKARMNKVSHANDWAVKLAARRGHNIAAVALAAKNARRIWALLKSGEVFQADYVQAKSACT